MGEAVRQKASEIFREEQRFRQPWLWAVLLSVTLVPTAILLALIFHMHDRPETRQPLLIVTAASLLGDALLLGAFWALKMVTVVSGDGVVVRLFPFPAQRISFQHIASCEARTYRPVAEYGGWGYRWGLSGRGRAINISGNQGVQLVLGGGKRLLIGSQRAEELEAAIRAGMR